MSFKKILRDAGKAWDMLHDAEPKRPKTVLAAIQSKHRALEVIRQSLEIIENSKNWETKKSRIAVVIKTAEQLLETCPFDDTRQKMRDSLPQYRGDQVEIHTAALKDKVDRAISKAQKQKNQQAKLQAVSDIHEFIFQFQAENQIIPFEKIEAM
jgi:hypothetical protein